ncbi:MAG: cytochrome bc complex cytochrome b subunit [Actinobacteria bacterium]|nr:cytochrome bc complex cytochrome b subunit [Actinomycetota bacterium]
MLIRRLWQWFDERLGASRFARHSLNKVFPDQWSFMLGEIALYCFLILVLTGIYLTFFFSPSSRDVVYHGHYKPLNGVHMSEAYQSTIRISFDVRAGLVMRQIHHWAANLFAAASVAHPCRVFFMGAFRKPREVDWLVGVTLLVLAIANGFAGYSLPDDLLSGTGLRIAYSIVLSVPVIGTWAAFLLFGGKFPASDIIERLFVIHILLIPLAIMALLGAHLGILWRQKHTQFAGRGRRDDNVVGSRLWPTYATKSVGLFAIILGVLSALGGLLQINPVWLYGPFRAPAVSTAAQPDWYLGWVEGALRITPPFYVHLGRYDIPELFWPAVAVPGVTFMLLYLWPFIEARFTHDHAEHHVLDNPSDRPVRTAIGVGVLTFYIVLLFAGGDDIIADVMGVPIYTVVNALRLLVIVLPIVTGLIAWKLCRDIRASGHVEEAEERTEPPIGPFQLPAEEELGLEPAAHTGGRSGGGDADTGSN